MYSAFVPDLVLRVSNNLARFQEQKDSRVAPPTASGGPKGPTNEDDNGRPGNINLW
jgi:hypothetical protein